MSRPLLRALLCGVICLGASFLEAAPRTQDQDRTKEAPAAEGPLDNDVFVPVSESANKSLGLGDSSLEAARSADAPESARLFDRAFDEWRSALLKSAPGDQAWFDLRAEGEHRLAEGVRAGVVRRLASLSSPERERWSQRFSEEAEKARDVLHAGYSPEERAARLRGLVRHFPLTIAAARSALELGDMALEAGSRSAARGWYSVASLEAELCGDSKALEALPARRAAVQPRAGPEEPWQKATSCDFVDSFVWAQPSRWDSDSPTPTGLRPGGAFVGNHFLLQTAAELVRLSVAPNGELQRTAHVRFPELLGGYTPELGFDVPREPPGWPLLPVADEEGVLLILGRTRPDEPNVLARLTLDEAPERPHLGLEVGSAFSTAHLSWAVAGAELLDGSLHAHPLPELRPLGDYEFQPGPVLSGDFVVVQARQFDGQVKSWLLAFERRSGALAWKLFLGGGADRVATTRFGSSARRVAGQPLLSLEVEEEPAVFVGTHLGLGVLVDSLLGEPRWSFKNRRRGEREPGWSGDRPLLADPTTAPLVLWGPMDSDRLYFLRPHLATGSREEDFSLQARRPAPLTEAHTLLGGDGEELLILGSVGRERTLSALRPGQDRIDALDLGPDERFQGLGLVSPQRVFACTNLGLYLFDRQRELYLLDVESVPSGTGTASGGDLYASGTHVFAVGSSAVWSFTAR